MGAMRRIWQAVTNPPTGNEGGGIGISFPLPALSGDYSASGSTPGRSITPQYIRSPHLKIAAQMRASAVAQQEFVVDSQGGNADIFGGRFNGNRFFYRVEYETYVWGVCYILLTTDGVPDLGNGGEPRVNGLKILNRTDVTPIQIGAGAEARLIGYRVNPYPDAIPPDRIIAIQTNDGEGAVHRLGFWLSIEENILRGRARASRFMAALRLIYKAKNFQSETKNAKTRKAIYDRLATLADDRLREDNQGLAILGLDLDTEDLQAFAHPRDEEFGQLVGLIQLAVSADSGVSRSALGNTGNDRWSNVYQYNRQFLRNHIAPACNNIASAIADALAIECHFDFQAIDRDDRDSALAVRDFAAAADMMRGLYGEPLARAWLAKQLDIQELVDEVGVVDAPAEQATLDTDAD